VLGIRSSASASSWTATVGRWWGMLVRYANFVGLGLRERLAGCAARARGKVWRAGLRAGTLLTIN